MSEPQTYFGDAAPQYNFIINPYPDMRHTSCPVCGTKTGQKKLPLVIHIEPRQLISLNYACRYCRAFDLLIAHKHEIESLLAEMFLQMDPSMIGNYYLIIGTMDKAAWRRNAKQPATPTEALASIHDFKMVYEELRRLAVARMANERSDHTLQATALVHEAYVRLVDVDQAQHWNSRGHFFGAAAGAMRRILVDRARRKNTPKHGGDWARIQISEVESTTVSKSDNLLALDEALTKLAAEEPAKAELVKLRYFAGLSIEEAADAMGISRTTASRYWAYARVWLFSELRDEEAEGEE